MAEFKEYSNVVMLTFYYLKTDNKHKNDFFKLNLISKRII